MQVSDNLPEDALSIAEVTISREATEQLQRCWTAKGGAMKELYPEFDKFLELFKQVLSRDVRSLHQRLRGGGKHALTQDLGLHPAQHSPADVASAASGAANDHKRTHISLPTAKVPYQLVLQGVRVWYSIIESKLVQIERAELVQCDERQQ